MQAGRLSWASVGVVVLALFLAAAIGALSGIVVPLVVAVVIGVVLAPVMRLLRRMHFSDGLAASVGLSIALVVATGVAAIMIVGFFGQLPEISRQLLLGWNVARREVSNLNIGDAELEQLRRSLHSYAPRVGLGALGVVSHTILGVISVATGLFFGTFLLFFVLRDHDRFPSWVSRSTHLDEELVVGVVESIESAVQAYFRGVAVTALITAPIFIVPLIVLRVPLILSTFILYFVLSFIPYVGAWLTSAFAILIALGSGGLSDALIVAISLIVCNGSIQNAVNSWAMGHSLKMHPVPVMLVTIVGGAVGGILGMILAVPLLAATTTSIEVVRSHRPSLAPPPTPAGTGGD